MAIREEGRELRGWNDRGWQEGEGFGRWKELGGQSVGVLEDVSLYSLYIGN